MKSLLLLVCLSLVLSGCATLLNPSLTEVTLYSEKDSTYIGLRNHREKVLLPAKIITERKNENLYLRYRNGDESGEILIQKKTSTIFWFGNLLLTYGAPVGYIVDLTNSKRFDYPKSITVNPKGKFCDYKKILPSEAGLIELKIGIPEGNYMIMNTDNGKKDRTGYFGFTASLNRFINKQDFYQIGFGTVQDEKFIIPSKPFYSGVYHKYSQTFIDFQKGRLYKDWRFTYGVSLLNNRYQKRTDNTLASDFKDSLLYQKTEAFIGGSFSVSWRANQTFELGLHYKPGLVNLSRGSFDYSQSFYLALLLNFEVFRPFRKLPYLVNVPVN